MTMLLVMMMLWLAPGPDARHEMATVVPVAASVQSEPERKPPTDKKVGVDAKGRTLYTGPRGGRYYIDDKGKKHYVRSKTQKKPRAQKRE